MARILILGGIREAVDLADRLVSEGHDVTTSLAGRTKEPAPIAGKVRIGGFGGATGLAEYLTTGQFDKLVDCTHPFAKKISASAKIAASETNVALEIISRPPWPQEPDDKWIRVNDLEEARSAVPTDARVLLALGSQYIDLFKNRADVFFLVRMIDAPKNPIALPNHELLLGKPSTDPSEEMEMLKNHRLTHIVCRNSGGKGAYAKIIAARKLGIPVIMIDRI